MDPIRPIAAIIALLIVTVLFYVGDPVLSGALYDRAYTVNPVLTDMYLNGWHTITPVFLFVILYYAATSGRRKDHPGVIREWA